MGMSRASIYRRIKLFRIAFGAHPDEFEMPGITLDLVAFRDGWAAKRRRPRRSRSPETPSDRFGIVSWMRLGAEPLWALSLYPDAGEGGGCLSVRAVGDADGAAAEC